MAYLNTVSLIGNIGAEPEVRTIDNNPQNPNGAFKLATFRVATTERFKDRSGETREQTQWHQCVAPGNLADIVEKYIHKGASVYVSGKLTYRSWKDKDGNDRNTTEIRVNTIQMLDRRPNAGQASAPTSFTAQPEPETQDLPF